MSKEQLGFEQLLKGKIGEEAAPESSPDSAAAPARESMAAPENASGGVFGKNSPASTTSASTNVSKETGEARVEIKTQTVKSKSARRKKAVVEDSKVEYSKKNWSKLDLGPAKTEPSEGRIEPVPSEKTNITRSTAKSRVAAHVSESEERDELTEKLVDEEPQVMTVSALNKNIRDILEGRFPLLWLKGEISNFKAHTSGHFYFSLKDAKAQISAVMFRGFNTQLRFNPEDGMEVIVRGKVTVYEPRGNYQIFCETMEPVGAGALQKAFEQLKAKLQSEGLFDAARKRTIPSLPRHIAIVTSPTGAAIRDMLNVLGRRFKGARITLIPCKVQGDQAPAEIVEAISLANKLDDVDVMIVGRGGGSIEDLWAFNDERVARAIAGSRVPTISAVGHEVDFTIADFVADLRAPTPSAAAELVVKNAADLLSRVNDIRRALRYAVLRRLNSARELTNSTSRRLIDPQRRIQDAMLRCDELMQRLENGVERRFRELRVGIELLRNRMGTPASRLESSRQSLGSLESRMRSSLKHDLVLKRERLELKMALLDSLSPLKVLDRGFSMVVIDGRIITQARDVKIGDRITVRMCQGSLEANVLKVDTEKKIVKE